MDNPVMEVDLPSSSLSTLLAAFSRWSEEHSFFISLLNESICDDGRFCLELNIDEDKQFTLYCPSKYPKSKDDHFFVEASSDALRMWCSDLNEFVLDSESELSIEVVLNKAYSLYYKKKNESPCLSSSESDGEFGVDEYMEGDDEWEHKILQLKKRWRLKEAQLRTITKKSKSSEIFDTNTNTKDHPTQVFSNSAASGILTNDLVAILESKNDTGINAEAVDDNIYKWSVFFSNFDVHVHADLDQDLKHLQNKYGYDYIELQLDFKMDLYPFFPPILKIIRPRLQGSMMVRVSSMNIVKLSHWNPARAMKDVLLEIKEYLGKFARLNLDSERNEIQRYPQGSYNSIENYLLCLACVSEIESRANRLYPTPEAMEIQVEDAKDKAVTTSRKVKFPAGTGYSSSSHIGWDVNAHLAAQKEKDKQIKQVLQKILNELIEFNLNMKSKTLGDNCRVVPVPICNLPYSNFTIPSCSRSQSSSRDHCLIDNCEHAAPIDPVDELFHIIEGSTLVPFLESKLQVDSFLEISQHRSVYCCIVDMLVELASHPKLVPLLWNLPDQVHSLYTLINKLNMEASIILARLGKVSSNGSLPKPHLEMMKKSSTKTSKLFGEPISTKLTQTPVCEDDTLARDFHQMSKYVSEALTKVGLLVIGESPSTSQRPASSNGSNRSVREQYMETLQALQFLSCDIEVSGANAHYFSDKFKKAYSTPAQVLRIAHEMASLSKSLPLDLGSSIFVRTDDAKCTLLRALIIGPEGTPYSNGCFVFDIFFPATYPLVPPNVQLRTTGLGTVRFNPNLYNNGMVCLSLLGTWKGLQGESWNPTSTLLQVLVSIQSLILVSEPYFNEPGYETLLGTLKGNTSSAAYSLDIMTQTIKYAMISNIQRPASGFEDVIRAHFIIKKDIIIKEVQAFLAKNPSKNLSAAYETLRSELAKLPSTYQPT